MQRLPMGDVVVLLPGITGSVLQKDGKDVWAFSGGAALRALTSLGRNIKALALDKDPPDVDDLGDGVTATRVMPDIHLIPGLWKIDGYGKVAAAIETRFDVEPGHNLFRFAYDWRRDNRVSARKLARESHQWLKDWRERSGNADAKLILVGHSMGGIVSRYFLECMDGWKDTRMLVTFGTPYRGSLNAVGFIASGMRKKLGPFTLMDLSALLRSFTSVYQLLPIYPCVDDGTGALRRVTETTAVPNLDADRAASALEFHAEIRAAVEKHLDDDAYMSSRYGIRPVVGMFQPTLQSARIASGRVEMLRTYGGEDQDGDGTVPRVSATPIELGNNPGAMYASERHASLQNFDAVLDQITAVFTEPRVDLEQYYAMNARLSLDIDDAYGADEPVPVVVRPEGPGVSLTAVVVNADTGEEAARQPLVPRDDGSYLAEIPPLDAGVYRLTVGGDFGIDPVTDIFAVFDDQEPPE